MKQCSICKENKDDSLFYKDRRHEDGLKSECKKCHCDQSIKSRNNHPEWWQNERERNAEKLLNKYKTYRVKNPEKVLWSRAKFRAKRKNIEFSIKVSDIKIPTHCPVLGIELKFGVRDNIPSLDRIDSNKGYIPGNVAVMYFRANIIKNYGTAEEHIKIAKWMIDNS